MIGIFDSGLGGLTILKEILKKSPDYDYIYLGDNARAPYGNKSRTLICDYTRQAVDFLFAKGCKLIIIACNTASAEALCQIQQQHIPSRYKNKKINVLGVVRPLVEAVARLPKITRVGVVGTRATITSRVYETELHKLAPDLKIFAQAAPLLVPLIEEGWLKRPETKMILKKYLRPLKQKQVQQLILGCTHYPFLLNDIRRIMTKRVLVPNPGEVVAQSLVDYLNRHPEYEIKPVANPALIFYTTDDVTTFKSLSDKFLGRAITNVEKISLP